MWDDSVSSLFFRLPETFAKHTVLSDSTGITDWNCIFERYRNKLAPWSNPQVLYVIYLLRIPAFAGVTVEAVS